MSHWRAEGERDVGKMEADWMMLLLDILLKTARSVFVR